MELYTIRLNFDLYFEMEADTEEDAVREGLKIAMSKPSDDSDRVETRMVIRGVEAYDAPQIELEAN